MTRMPHRERHRTDRIGWLRAAVLGANDGILSTASLITGVAAADGSHQNVLIAGIAGLVAGAMSMAAGEYVSVSSQADTEEADLARERKELATDPEFELAELTKIYVERGVSPELARQVAIDLTAKDALAAHARDELGFTHTSAARPLQAAIARSGDACISAISSASTIRWVVMMLALHTAAGNCASSTVPGRVLTSIGR